MTWLLFKASTKLRTTATIAIRSLSLLTAEPTPIPEAPAATAIGAVTSDKPDAHITGASTAREIAWAAARVGEAFSIKPKIPLLWGWELVPPSVWMISAPASTNFWANSTCSSKAKIWGTVTDKVTSGNASRVWRVKAKTSSAEKVMPWA